MFAAAAADPAAAPRTPAAQPASPIFKSTARRVEVGPSGIREWGTASLFRVVTGDEDSGSMLKRSNPTFVAPYVVHAVCLSSRAHQIHAIIKVKIDHNILKSFGFSIRGQDFPNVDPMRPWRIPAGLTAASVTTGAVFPRDRNRTATDRSARNRSTPQKDCYRMSILERTATGFGVRVAKGTNVGTLDLSWAKLIIYLIDCTPDPDPTIVVWTEKRVSVELFPFYSGQLSGVATPFVSWLAASESGNTRRPIPDRQPAA
jgi:hypothetical protein